jgi:hypothetical protein
MICSSKDIHLILTSISFTIIFTSFSRFQIEG